MSVHGRRLGGVAIAGLAALAWPAAGAACTPQEYLTDEELASGLYDTSPPPDYGTGPGLAHTHDEAPAAAPADAAPAPPPPAPENAAAPAKRTTQTSSTPARRTSQAPAKPATPAPAPAARQSAPAPPPAAAAVVPHVHAPATPQRTTQTVQRVVRAPAAAKPAVRAANVRPERVGEPRHVVALAFDPSALTTLGDWTAAPGASAGERAGADWLALALLLGLAGLLGTGARLVAARRPGGGIAVGRLGPEADPVEAELQAMLEAERVRRLATQRFTR
ncbi:MAG TPA: hypothetical protein VD931_21295 [Baekduia sp.]|nr:hypothetical protein [Baekduia sp.]